MARKTLAALKDPDDDGDSTAVMLLGDVRDIFEKDSIDRIKSANLAHKLGAIEGRLWDEWVASWRDRLWAATRTTGTNRDVYS